MLRADEGLIPVDPVCTLGDGYKQALRKWLGFAGVYRARAHRTGGGGRKTAIVREYS